MPSFCGILKRKMRREETGKAAATGPCCSIEQQLANGLLYLNKPLSSNFDREGLVNFSASIIMHLEMS